jgi:hypothetical protein
MAAIEGTCLCGDVHITVKRAPKSLTECNCSACRRYGTLWGYYKMKDVTIRSPRGGLVTYMRERGGLRFRRCGRCGCVVSWEWKRRPDARMGLNARLLDHAAMASVPISILDGDGRWARLGMYKCPEIWISPNRTKKR